MFGIACSPILVSCGWMLNHAAPPLLRGWDPPDAPSLQSHLQPKIEDFRIKRNKMKKD